MCALLEMAFNVGMLLGPLISGSLLETLGYFYLNCFMCKSVRIFPGDEHQLTSDSHCCCFYRGAFLYLLQIKAGCGETSTRRRAMVLILARQIKI